jgi:hypothetical protein
VRTIAQTLAHFRHEFATILEIFAEARARKEKPNGAQTTLDIPR